MAKRKSYDTSVSELDEIDDRPSRSDLRQEHKEEQAALLRLMKRLLSLPPKGLASLNLSPDIMEALRHFAAMRKKGGAVARQRRLIFKYLRALDYTALTKRADDVYLGATDNAQSHRLERWRTRLLTEGDTALSELFDAFPHAERQKVRQCVRVATAEYNAGTDKKKQKDLFRMLKELVTSADSEEE